MYSTTTLQRSLHGTVLELGPATRARLDTGPLDLADASADAVVATHLLCSVADPAAALAELFRVLRPGGRYVFAEHVAAPAGTWLRRAQHGCAVVSGLLGGHCMPDRDSLPAIERAGFDVVELHSRSGAGIPHIAGCALRPAVLEGEPS